MMMIVMTYMLSYMIILVITMMISSGEPRGRDDHDDRDCHDTMIIDQLHMTFMWIMMIDDSAADNDHYDIKTMMMTLMMMMMTMTEDDDDTPGRLEGREGGVGCRVGSNR